jgi:hypothetical protein
VTLGSKSQKYDITGSQVSITLNESFDDLISNANNNGKVELEWENTKYPILTYLNSKYQTRPITVTNSPHVPTIILTLSRVGNKCNASFAVDVGAVNQNSPEGTLLVVDYETSTQQDIMCKSITEIITSDATVKDLQIKNDKISLLIALMINAGSDIFHAKYDFAAPSSGDVKIYKIVNGNVTEIVTGGGDSGGGGGSGSGSN